MLFVLYDAIPQRRPSGSKFVGRGAEVRGVGEECNKERQQTSLHFASEVPIDERKKSKTMTKMLLMRATLIVRKRKVSLLRDRGEGVDDKVSSYLISFEASALKSRMWVL